MSENSDSEARSFDDDAADGDKAVAELKQSMDRLRGHVGAFRSRVGDNDNHDAEDAEA